MNSKHQIGGSHYLNMKLQPIDFILQNELSFCEGNIIKYVVRHRSKNGKEDLLKALHYLNFLIDDLYGEDPEPVKEIMETILGVKRKS